jgi:hypothetical protein
MGLDMYLEGHVYHYAFGAEGEIKRSQVDGFDVKRTVLDLGY